LDIPKVADNTATKRQHQQEIDGEMQLSHWSSHCLNSSKADDASSGGRQHQ